MAVKDWSTTAADNDDADAGINWLEGQSPATVNDSARAMMAAIASWYALIDAGTVSGGTVGGTANAITLTCSPTVSALAAGQRYLFKYTSTGNTDAVTLTVDGLGSTPALRYKDVALVAGDIATSDWILCVYDGTRFQMLNQPRISWGATDIPTDATGGAVGDLILFADASETGTPINKVTTQKLLDNAMTGLTAETAPDVADSLLIYDATESAANTTTITNFYKTINGLTADATPDGAADYIPTYDNSASAGKKVLIQDLAATQAQQEAGAVITNFVTPLRQHYHPSAAKFHSFSLMSAGAPGASSSTTTYNVTSHTDSGVGLLTITIATDFSAVTYSCVCGTEWDSGEASGQITGVDDVATRLVGSVLIRSMSTGASSNATNQDPGAYHTVGYGDQ